VATCVRNKLAVFKRTLNHHNHIVPHPGTIKKHPCTASYRNYRILLT